MFQTGDEAKSGWGVLEREEERERRWTRGVLSFGWDRMIASGSVRDVRDVRDVLCETAVCWRMMTRSKEDVSWLKEV